jgi:hypothetical protein
VIPWLHQIAVHQRSPIFIRAKESISLLRALRDFAVKNPHFQPKNAG